MGVTELKARTSDRAPHLPTLTVLRRNMRTRTERKTDTDTGMEHVFDALTDLFVERYQTYDVLGANNKFEMRVPLVHFSTNDLLERVFGYNPPPQKERTIVSVSPGHKETPAEGVTHVVSLIDQHINAYMDGKPLPSVDIVIGGYPDSFGGGVANQGIGRLQTEGFKYYGDVFAKLIRDEVIKPEQKDLPPVTRMLHIGKSMGTHVASYIAKALENPNVKQKLKLIHPPGRHEKDDKLGEHGGQVIGGRYTEKIPRTTGEVLGILPKAKKLRKEFFSAVKTQLKDQKVVNNEEDRKYIDTLLGAEKARLALNFALPEVSPNIERLIIEAIFDPLSTSTERIKNYVLRRRVRQEGNTTYVLTAETHSPVSYPRREVRRIRRTASRLRHYGVVVNMPPRQTEDSVDSMDLAA